MTKEEALKLRAVIEQGTASLDDKTASTAPTLFPALKQDGRLVKAGTRINWRGVVKRAAVALWDTVENDPDHAPTLWEDILFRDGIRIIPETITAGAAFAVGELGWWDNVLCRSKLSANVYTPAQYAEGWEIVEEA